MARGRVATFFARSTKNALRLFASMGKLLGRLIDAVISPEGAIVAGLCLVAYGLWQVYRPAAEIAPGAILLALGVFGVRKLGDR